MNKPKPTDPIEDDHFEQICSILAVSILNLALTSNWPEKDLEPQSKRRRHQNQETNENKF